MITINDKDLPIEAAEKIITGTRPISNETLKSFCKLFTDDPEAGGVTAMYDIEEIKEIADHLLVYYHSNLR